MKRLLLPAALVLAAGGLQAHPLVPEAACSEPVRPPRTDTERWNSFVGEVNTYRACIAGFVEAEYAASDAHRAGAERATQRWNQFVRDHLNVPEDFPHMPRRANP